MEQITLIEDTIHRPDEPRHFMEFTFPTTRYVAFVGEQVIADSVQVLKLSEVGYHIYDPVIYFPLVDTQSKLIVATEKSSHCPLKGDTTYYDFVAEGDTIKDIGWCYSAPLDFAQKLADYVAFNPKLVKIVNQ